MKPTNIVAFPERVRDALLDNKLGELIDYLEDQDYMRKALEKYFKLLSKRGESIPLELDWVYAQYNPITVPKQLPQN